MRRLHAAERARIDSAVVEAERHTSAEFVAVLARRTDSYLHVTLTMAGVGALLAGGLTLLVWRAASAADLLAVEIIVFSLLVLLLRWQPLLMFCVPRSIRRRRGARMARELFIDLGLLDTQGRTGVLFFVARGERHVEIIADRGVASLVGDDAWQAVIDRFTTDVKAGRLSDGMVTAITACGAILAERLPAGDDNANELHDGLVEL